MVSTGHNPEKVNLGGFEVDYSSYLRRHDVVYKSPADRPFEGLPIGNGDLGALLWSPSSGFQVIINKCDVWDDAPAGNFDGWSAQMEEKYSSNRGCGTITIDSGLPVNDYFYLSDFEGRLSLYEAEASFHSQTPFSETDIWGIISEVQKVGVLKYKDQLEEEVSRRVNLARWGSRIFAHWYKQVKRDPRCGLEGTQSGHDDLHLWIHQKLREMEFVVMARVVGIEGHIERDHSRSVNFVTSCSKAADLVVYYTVVTSEESSDPLSQAKEQLERAVSVGYQAIRQEHRRRWAEFWPKSFVYLSFNNPSGMEGQRNRSGYISDPGDYLENLWYITLYLVASSSRGRYPANFIDGLWSWNRDFRAWAHFYHWNQQEVYWFLGPANHSELELPYLNWRFEMLPHAMEYAHQLGKEGAAYNDVANRRGYQDSRKGMELNRTPGLQIAMDFWRHYQYTGDEEFLRNRAWPVMKQTALYHLSILERGEDGKLHVPPSSAYEGLAYVFLDTITDLAAIRQSFKAVAEAAEILGCPEEARPFVEALDTLTDFTIIDLPACYYKKRGDELFFNRDFPFLADYAADPRFFATGFTGDDRVDLAKVFSIGFLVDNGQPFTWKQSEPQHGKYMFRGTQEAPVFPAGIVGLKDRGTERFRAAVTGAKGNWTPSHGHAILPIVFARLGMREELKKYLLDFPALYQYFPQGFFNYTVLETFHSYLHDQYSTNQVRDAGHPEEGEHPFRKSPFVHFSFDTSGVFCAALTEMLLQSYDGVVRVFPAMPSHWSGAFRLKVVGGFLVEAILQEGEVGSLKITSERGGPLRIELPWPDKTEEVVTLDESGAKLSCERHGNEIIFVTQAGESYWITTQELLRVSPQKVKFSGEPNRTPKVYGRVQIGKGRDF